MHDDLGLDKAEVRLAPHNPAWVDLGEQECDAVDELLGGLACAVIHVGSTSVPGLDAKPILDLAVAVEDGTALDDVVARLCAGGRYSYEGDKGHGGGLLFVRGEGSFRSVHVHVVEKTSTDWADYLRFRELLLRTPPPATATSPPSASWRGATRWTARLHPGQERRHRGAPGPDGRSSSPQTG